MAAQTTATQPTTTVRRWHAATLLLVALTMGLEFAHVLRDQWDYTHALGFVLFTAAFLLLLGALIREADR